jgi:ABC-type dipeptide/oligopeptide/nickel transport system ATPase component
MLKHISIRKLFSLYDYEIGLTGKNGNPDKNIMFLTGPNGMGKSTILHSVASLYKREFIYFMTFPFERMHFVFDECEVDLIQFTETEDGEMDSDIPVKKKTHLKCSFFTKGKDTVTEFGEWVMIDGSLGTIQGKMPNMEMYFNGERCLYISDHRLEEEYDDTFVQPLVLKNLIGEIQSTLTSGFASNQIEKISDEHKADRQKDILDIFIILQKSEIELPFDIIPYLEGEEMSDLLLLSSENAIKSCGNKIPILLSFCKFMDSSKFLGKSYRITKQDGLQFYAENEDRSFLKFKQLSLGEKNLISQIYTMYFSKIPCKLVIVDEPELSAHLMWQAQYLENIKAVQKLRNCSFLIATHSTVVFDGKFDLTTDLFEQTHL